MVRETGISRKKERRMKGGRGENYEQKLTKCMD